MRSRAKERETLASFVKEATVRERALERRISEIETAGQHLAREIYGEQAQLFESNQRLGGALIELYRAVLEDDGRDDTPDLDEALERARVVLDDLDAGQDDSDA